MLKYGSYNQAAGPVSKSIITHRGDDWRNLAHALAKRLRVGTEHLA